MSRTPSPLPTNIDAATAVAANASAIPLSPGRTPISTITAAATANAITIAASPGGTPFTAMGLKIGGAKSLKLIGTTIPNVVAGNRGGNGTAQKAANANIKKGLGHFQPAQPPRRGTKGCERNQSTIASSPGGVPFTAMDLNIGGAIPLIVFAPPGASGRQQNLSLIASLQLTTQSNPGFSASLVGGSGAAQAGGTSTTTQSN
jgi:hypothetical protein